MSTGQSFTIVVSVLEGGSSAYEFDRDRVVVGRAADADLRLEHPGVSRTQFVIERAVSASGEPRFRIVPTSTRNPTLVNGQRVIEGAIRPGDVIAVVNLRMELKRSVPRRLPIRNLPSRRELFLGCSSVAIILTVRRERR